MTTVLLVALSGAVAVAAGCGGGDDSGEDAEPTATTAESATTTDAGCVDSWNTELDESLKGLVNLSNDPDADVVVGTYAGEPFSAEVFDATTEGTGDEVEVQPGDCVVSQFSKEFDMPLFVFVRGSTGGDAEWHRLSETGKHPLADQADPLLDGAVQASVVEGGDLQEK